MCYLLRYGRFPLSSFVPYAIIEIAAENGRMHLNNTHLPIAAPCVTGRRKPAIDSHARNCGLVLAGVLGETNGTIAC